MFRRQYAEPDQEADFGIRKIMPDGFYWYLYELWQDGRTIERKRLREINPTLCVNGIETRDESVFSAIEKAKRNQSTLQNEDSEENEEED